MENNIHEIWKDVVGFEGRYQVSNKGRVKSLDREIKTVNGSYIWKGRLLSASKIKNRYPNVALCNYGKPRSYEIHRLVGLAFIENPLNKRIVNHINGIKNDNRVENLEWVTHQENMAHAIKTGLINQNGENSVLSKFTKDDIIKIRKRYSEGVSAYRIAKDLGFVCKATIWNIVKGITYKHT